MKHTKANRPLEPLIYHHYPDNEKLCIVKCLQSYIWIPNTLVMQDIRDIIISLFVTESHTNQCHQRQYLEGLKKNTQHLYIGDDMKFPGVSKKIAFGISTQGWPRKIYVEFPGVLVFGVRISKRCNVILHNFQGCSYDLSGISRGKVNKQKNSRGNFQKSMSLMPPTLFFFWNSPLYLNFWRYFL